MEADSDLLPTEWLVCAPNTFYEGVSAYVLDSASLGNELDALRLIPFVHEADTEDYTDNCLVVN